MLILHTQAGSVQFNKQTHAHTSYTDLYLGGDTTVGLIIRIVLILILIGTVEDDTVALYINRQCGVVTAR